MSRKDRLFFIAWGLVIFPCIIIVVTIKFNLGAPVIIALLTYMSVVKFLLERDSNTPDPPTEEGNVR